MTVPMLMMPPPTVRTRFGDWPLALKSIVGFWSFYALTVVLRALLAPNALNAISDKLLNIGVGIVVTGLIYVAIAGMGSRASLRRKTVIAALASLIGAVAMSGTLSLLEGEVHSKEEFRYQAREGFVVIEKDNKITIERSAQEPLVLTMPNPSEMGTKKRMRYIADSAIVWLFFFMAWSAFYVATLSHEEALGVQRRLADAESAAQAAQVRALRYQVNPHFLFNTLNSLSSLVMTGRTDRAETMLLALSTFFRTSLSLDPSAEVSLAEEIDLQRLYLDIEMARFPDRLNVEIDVPQELEQARLPALLLQPIVENAIKYGVSKSRKAVVIRIEARHLDNHRMVLEISNRLKHGGKEELPAATHEGTGTGLVNVCQRLEARWGNRASCRFGAMTGGGYKVSLTMPVELNDRD
ncbi:MAG: two-component system, LytTR family, sensor kinase [Sphingomonadales bacterium]|jgi:two-component system LytT family sensor kinase|nr:two-component system, LytTR family, sensor kinase [Sphingomonadales bacterium]